LTPFFLRLFPHSNPQRAPEVPSQRLFVLVCLMKPPNDKTKGKEKKTRTRTSFPPRHSPLFFDYSFCFPRFPDFSPFGLCGSPLSQSSLGLFLDLIPSCFPGPPRTNPYLPSPPLWGIWNGPPPPPSFSLVPPPFFFCVRQTFPFGRPRPKYLPLNGHPTLSPPASFKDPQNRLAPGVRVFRRDPFSFSRFSFFFLCVFEDAYSGGGVLGLRKLGEGLFVFFSLPPPKVLLLSGLFYTTPNPLPPFAKQPFPRLVVCR